MPLPTYSGWHQCTAEPKSVQKTCARTEGYGTDNCHGFVPHLQALVLLRYHDHMQNRLERDGQKR